MLQGIVKAISLNAEHNLKKQNQSQITLLKGLGVEGDAHMGKTVKHESMVKKDAYQPNLRQVHLIHSELHEELKGKGFLISAGEMGENITTSGIDILNLPKGSILKIGAHSKLEITGLRSPCHQLESLQKGLMAAVLGKDNHGNLVRKAGIMAIVLEGGKIKVDDIIEVELPNEPFEKLQPV